MDNVTHARDAATMSLGRIREILAPILSCHEVERALVFGSYARGTQNRRSDIDLLLVKKTAERFLDRYAEFGDIYRALDGSEVDLLIYTPDELARNAGRTFLRTVMQEGVVVYEH